MNTIPRIDPDRDRQLAPLRAILDQASSVLSIAHPNMDGDAIGSQLGLHHWCLANGKRSTVLNFDSIPPSLAWLPGVRDAVDRLPESDQYDAIFLMETTEASRMGDRVRFFKRAKTAIHLDHHIGVVGLGDLNLLDQHASSVCEILFDLLVGLGLERMPKAALECLYLGMMTDTGCFRYRSTNRHVHEIAGWMVEYGVDPLKLYKSHYEANPFRRIVLHGRALARAERSPDGRIAFTTVTLDDYQQTGAGDSDSDGIAGALLSITGVEAAAFFRELPDGGIKVSCRSSDHIDVQEICKRFGGGGHRQAASVTLKADLDGAKKTLLPLLFELGAAIAAQTQAQSHEQEAASSGRN